MTYAYDGDVKRVKKSNGKLYWYGVYGEVLTETDLSGNNPTEYIYFNGRRIARRDPSGTVYYVFADHLGSTRIITDANGYVQRGDDYYPYGGELLITGSVADNLIDALR